MIAYDYMLTLRQEVKLFWRHRFNASSMLFFANRYLVVFYYVVMVYYRTLIRPYPVSYFITQVFILLKDSFPIIIIL